MVITHSPLPQNIDNLPWPFFGGTYPIFLRYKICYLSYMYIKWFTRIIFFDDHICYEKIEVTRILQFSQRNGRSPLTWQKQGNYLLMPIYDGNRTCKFDHKS